MHPMTGIRELKNRVKVLKRNKSCNPVRLSKDRDVSLVKCVFKVKLVPRCLGLKLFGTKGCKMVQNKLIILILFKSYSNFKARNIRQLTSNFNKAGPCGAPILCKEEFSALTS